MISGKEKLYFLLNRIEDIRAIVPSGQPLLVDPAHNLNNKYTQVELSQLFSKLEKDERVLKVLKATNRTKTLPDELDPDPYDHADDGCWHIELLPAFDNYFLKIQQEPKYQEFTGKKPQSSQTKTSGNALMTYEEKLDLIVKAVIEARKATRKGQTTTLYLNATNGLDCLDREETRNILLQLQDENALKLNPKTNRLLPLNQQPANANYFLIDNLDGFDDWYASYLIQQKSKPDNLDWLNLLKVLDVCSDIDQQIQMIRNTSVTIPSFPYPYIGRFLELFPYDSIGTRKSYQQHRWEGAQYLLRQGIAIEVKAQTDNVLGYGNIAIKIDPVKFDDFYKTVKDEFEKRKKSFDKKEKKPKTIDTANVKLKATYNAPKGKLDIEGKKVKFKKDSFRAKLLELLLKDDESRKKEWSWDEVIDEIQGTEDSPSLRKENKKKFYPACDGLSKHIAQKIGVNDLLLYNKSTVQVNPKYL